MLVFLGEARFNDEFACNSNLALVSGEDFGLNWSNPIVSKSNWSHVVISRIFFIIRDTLL